MKCQKCKSEKSVKNGKHLGRQRYKCKDCGFQYTREQPRGKSIETKCLLIILYLNGLSFRAIAKIVNVSPKSVYDWVKAFGLQTYEKPRPDGEIIVELDEMWHFLTKKKNKLWIWKAYSELISPDLLIQTKAQTHGIERNNFRQRHWFGRFRIKTCIVSRCRRMVDITMSLFARFRVNGSTDMIKSFFS